MLKKQIENIILEILKEVAQKDISEKDFKEKGYFSFLDSFSFIHFVSLLEEKLNITFTPEELAAKNFKTNEGLYKTLEEKLK